MSVNKVILLGHLCGDPKIKTFSDGSKAARFSLATNERYKDGNEYKEHAEFHNIVMRGRNAEIAEQYLKKGDRIYLDGKLRFVKWEKDGQQRQQVDIVVNTFVMLTPKQQQSKKQEEDAQPIEPTDNLPF
jgi:single-strand DNA-binding protein|nr:MAG TPA: Single strand binding protein [Bacteriophage sp.]